MEAIGGFPETGVNSREHPGQVWGWKRWRVGHTGDIRGSVGVQLSEMGHLGSSSSCFDLKNKNKKQLGSKWGSGYPRIYIEVSVLIILFYGIKRRGLIMPFSYTCGISHFH